MQSVTRSKRNRASVIYLSSNLYRTWDSVRFTVDPSTTRLRCHHNGGGVLIFVVEQIVGLNRINRFSFYDTADLQHFLMLSDIGRSRVKE